MKINEIKCKLFGHKWRYNFKSMPSKAICERCHCKSKLNIYNLEWEEVDGFLGESRTCSELVEQWIK